MRLGSTDGPWVQLEPVGYQFPASASKVTERDWDANWLVITGLVMPVDGPGWSFTDACLTTGEARAFADWLRAVAVGEVRPGAFSPESFEGLLWFTEHCIAFSLASRSDDGVVIRVHLSLEALPADMRSDGPELFEYFVLVPMTSSELARAADDWLEVLSPFPVR